MCMPLSPVQGTYGTVLKPPKYPTNCSKVAFRPKMENAKKGTSFTFLKSSQCMEGVQRLNYDDVVEHAYLTSNRILGDCDSVGIVSGSSLIRQRTPNSTDLNRHDPESVVIMWSPWRLRLGATTLFLLPARGSSPNQVASWPKHGTHKFVVYPSHHLRGYACQPPK